MIGGLEPAKVTLTLTPTSVVVGAAGDIAVEEGTWNWSNPLPDGSALTDNGKYLVAWKKIDGTWLMQTDIWNSDNPPPPAPAGHQGIGVRMRRLATALSLTAALAACQPTAAKVDLAAEEQAIRTQVAVFNAGVRRLR